MLYCDGEILVPKVENREPTSDKILLDVSEVLKAKKIKLQDVDCFAVVLGPGSFTGLRASVTMVKALAIALDKKIVGITSFQALEYNAKGDTILVLDGFGSFVYMLYGCEAKCEQIENVRAFISKKFLSVYAGSQAVIDKLGVTGTVCKYAPFSAVISKVEKGEFYDAGQLEPIYLRASQAEIEREKKLKNDKD